jgi:hypothetical protein
MPFQPTRTLTAYVMADALKDAVHWTPSLMGLVRFGGLKLDYFQLMLICLDAYIKGAAMGYTFRDKYTLLLSTMVKPDKAEEYATSFRNMVEKRMDSYGQEINSVIDFFIATELTKDKLSFDDFLDTAKKKVKIDSAGPKIKAVFEEGSAFGANYPDVVARTISLENRKSSLDWEKAKLRGLIFNLHNQEMDLTFLQRWATHNLRTYCRESFPEMIVNLGL